MAPYQHTSPDSITPDLIAPCGMDCGLCIAHLREKNCCAGCRDAGDSKPKHCLVCSIKTCPRLAETASDFCGDCPIVPCARLRRLDERYRAKYGMSMLDNLARIRDDGIEHFVACERIRWSCPACGGVICVHANSCIYCGGSRSTSSSA